MMSYVLAVGNAVVGGYCLCLAVQGNQHQRKVFVPLTLYFVFATVVSLARL